MATAVGYNGGILGIGRETVFGTPVTPTKFIELTSDGLASEDKHGTTNPLNRTYRTTAEVFLAETKAGGDIGVEPMYEGYEMLIKDAMGACTTTEVSSFTVDATNNKFNFNIGAAELTATIASATYAMGASQATAGSLCKAIYDAIVAAEAVGTYTVTFSSTTKKITITRSAGTFQILWKTGTNGSDGTDTHIGTLIGYTDSADDTGALTYIADSAVVTVYNNVFTMSDSLPISLTLEKQIDSAITNLKGYTYSGCRINAMDLTLNAGEIMTATFGIIAQQETAITAALTTATLSTVRPIVFTQAALVSGLGTITTKTKSLTLSLKNSLKDDSICLGSELITDAQLNGKREITGSYTIEFDSETAYNAYRARTAESLTLTCTGATIKTGHTYTLTVSIPVTLLNGSSVKTEDSGLIYVETPFTAYATDSATREMTLTLKNTIASVA